MTALVEANRLSFRGSSTQPTGPRERNEKGKEIER